MRSVAVALLILATGLSGCTDFIDGIEDAVGEWVGMPYDSIAVSPVETGTWTNENRFRVVVTHDEAVAIDIVATELDTGATVTESGTDDLTASLPDGRWDLAYSLDGEKHQAWSPVLIDTTAPVARGLRTLVAAPDGRHTIDAVLDEPATLVVQDLTTGRTLGSALPIAVAGLDDGLHLFLVSALDLAGNYGNETVQVFVGDATELPAGQYDFGIVARYRNEVRVWDLTGNGDDLTPAEARAAAGGAYLGRGHAITPDNPTIQGIVAEVVTPEMSAMETAWALYQWLFDALEYDVARLAEDDLLTPVQTIDNGGGVCRDLAALYASLVRAAGVPARVVSGYLAGDVNGFHAWVEFYGGSNGEGPWVPVDVSVIGRTDRSGDDAFSAAAAMQSFGLLPADYLPLTAVKEAGEVDGWSSAMSLRYSHHVGNAPDLRFEEAVTSTVDGVSTDVFGTLCINVETRDRLIVDDPSQCDPARFSAFIRDFLARTQRTIDYGIAVVDAGEGTVVDVWATTPAAATVRPNDVKYRFYGPAIDAQDPDTGKAHARFKP